MNAKRVRMSALGQKPEVAALRRDVCFAPVSGHRQAVLACPKSAASSIGRRKIFHHFTFYGFGLCFASTSGATLYHYLLAREAPYAWWDLPVVLGTLGGIGLLIGPAGLWAEKWKRDPALVDQARTGMDVAFIVMLFMTSLTGMALLLWRDTSAIG